MLKNFKKSISSDRGDSELISLIILLPLVVAILITIIDSSIYFSNRSIVQSSAHDGARTVAILGGNEATPISAAYGAPRSSGDCEVGQTDTECAIYNSLSKNKGLIGVEFNSIVCSPDRTRLGMGEETRCEIGWTYKGIPGSSLGFIKSTNETGKKVSPFRENVTIGTSQSEVKLP